MKKTTLQTESEAVAVEIRKKSIEDIHNQSGRILSLYDMKERGLTAGERCFFGEAVENPISKELMGEFIEDAKVSERAEAIVSAKIDSEEAILQQLVHDWLTILN